MRRRDAITTLVALAAGSVAPLGRAQPPRVFRVGLLPDLDPESRAAFSFAMEKLGWSEGKQYVIDASGLKAGMHVQPLVTRMVTSLAPLTERDMEAGTRRLLDRKPDVILATSTAYARTAQKAASDIPIVMWTGGYPVEAGVADSLAHPGRNLTGNTVYAGTGVWGKLLELVHETKPSVRRVGVLWDYTPPAFPREEIEPCHRELQRAAQKLGLQLSIVELDAADHLEAALDTLQSEKVGALVVTSGWESARARPRIMEFATQKKLPVAIDFRWRSVVAPYPLIVYSASQDELMQAAASYVIRILNGARPGDLPIQQPARFDLVVNMKTARLLGLTMPEPLLLRASEVVR